MEKNLQHIVTLLQNIKGSGTFIVSGSEKLIIPGLRIKGFGEVSFPINKNQSQSLISISKKAPFGKGSKTIYDESIRKVQEIDAASISFHNPEWIPFLERIVIKVKKGLGIDKEKTVNANLYKLLIYEPDSFFLPHKDSEKEKGMFGTLIIGLPSQHTGGELKVSFDNRTTTIDFSETGNSYEMPYTAFFSDCLHEVKAVTSGYRICLIYNLVSINSTSQIKSPKFSLQQNEMEELLLASTEKFQELPKAILLGHEYTPANFSLANLKGHDKPRAEALLNAAKQSGYHASLALVTHYQYGQLESDYYYDDYYSYRRGRREEPEVEGTMGEVIEEYSYIEHWDGNTPGLGELHLEQNHIIANLNLGEGNPTETDEEGYTGNAGMTVEYWYHYGAIVLWPKNEHITILKGRPLENQLQWLNYYIEKNQVPNSTYTSIIKEIITSIAKRDFNNINYRNLNFDIFIKALCHLGKEDLLHKSNTLLSNVFDAVTIKGWILLVQNFPLDSFKKILTSAGNSNDLYKIGQLISFLKNSINGKEKSEVHPVLLEQIEQVPKYISSAEIHKVNDSYKYYQNGRIGRLQIAKRLIQDILMVSFLKDNDNPWIKEIALQITKSLFRKYLNKVLLPELIKSQHKTSLFYSIKTICLQELLEKTRKKPEPPKDWVRKVPNTRYHNEIWNMLSPFLNSPTDSVFEYRANQQLRQEVENAIKNVTIDLKTETITKGRPYTLKITKTRQEYKKLMKYWKEDKIFLEQLENLK